MMFSPGKQGYDDQLLIRYLLGLLPEQEIERLDELSIAGDDFACRLRDVENDLVDAYASGELSGEILASFQSCYLSSVKGREKVRFAEAFLAHEAGAPAPQPAGVETAAEAGSTRRRRGFPQRWRLFAKPHYIPNWGFAAAACLLIAGAGYLLLQHQALRSQLYQAQADRTEFQRRALTLQKQLDERRSSESLAQAGQRPNSSGPAAGTTRRPPKVLAFLLLPQLRGAGQPARIAVPPRTGRVVLQLQLEFDDFPKYRAILRNSLTNQIIWRSQNLTAISAGRNRAVSAGLPAAILKQQNYTLELTGIPANGPSEPIGSYSFSVVIE